MPELLFRRQNAAVLRSTVCSCREVRRDDVLGLEALVVDEPVEAFQLRIGAEQAGKPR